MLASKATEWLNQQRTTPTRFSADSDDVLPQARRWLKAGWNWQLLRKALDLRLASLKEAKPDTWENWVTPATMFNGKLRRFVEEAEAGHTYRAPATAPHQTPDAAHPRPRVPDRHERASELAEAERRKGAERAFADVLTVAGIVGTGGDWKSKLRHNTARRVIRAIGWVHIVEQGEAIRDQFLGQYLGQPTGGPHHGIAHAAA